MLIEKGVVIAGSGGARIEEFIGRTRTRTESMSIARVTVPPSWSEPPRMTARDEAVIVLSGILTVETEGDRHEVTPGSVAMSRSGQRVRLANDQLVPCEYWSICTPPLETGRARTGG